MRLWIGTGTVNAFTSSHCKITSVNKDINTVKTLSFHVSIIIVAFTAKRVSPKYVQELNGNPKHNPVSKIVEIYYWDRHNTNSAANAWQLYIYKLLLKVLSYVESFASSLRIDRLGSCC